MTFKEISAWIETAAVLVLYGYYAAQAPSAVTAGTALGLYLKIAIAFVVLVVLLNIAAALLHRPEKEDERDRLIGVKSARNAWWALMTGVFAAVVVLVAPISAFDLPMPQATIAVHLLVLTMAAGELLRFGSQIVYYRRGA